MIEHGFYFIKDAYFDEMADPNLKWNKNEKRPHYYCIQDTGTGFYWMIPLSSRIEKYRKIVEKRENTGRRCDTVYITKLSDGRESAFLIQDMIPVTSDYIDREYTLGGIPFRLTSERVIRDIDIRAKRILGLIRNDVKFGPKQPDIKTIMGKLGKKQNRMVYMNKLVQSLKDTILNPTYEIAFDYAEIAIDAVFENEALKEIPFVRTLTSFCKIGYNIRERNLMKQTLAFIKEFNSGSITQEKLSAYRKKLEVKPKEAEKELERVLIILGNQVEQIQSRVLGRFYAAYVNGDISWEKFCELSEANRRMFISDYQILLEAAVNNGLNIENRELYQVDRLISLGLLQNQNRLGGSVWIEVEGETEEEKDIIVTSFGKTFYNHSSGVFKHIYARVGNSKVGQ